jgi:hypothetical protein
VTDKSSDAALNPLRWGALPTAAEIEQYRERSAGLRTQVASLAEALRLAIESLPPQAFDPGRRNFFVGNGDPALTIQLPVHFAQLLGPGGRYYIKGGWSDAGTYDPARLTRATGVLSTNASRAITADVTLDELLAKQPLAPPTPTPIPAPPATQPTPKGN